MNISASALDLIVAVCLLWWAYRGFRRGFVLTVFDTVFRAGTLAAVEVWSASVASYFVTHWRVATDFAMVGAIGVLVLSFEVIRRMGARGLQAGSDVLFRESPGWRYTNRIAGLATGVARGTVTLTLLLVVALLLPLGSAIPTPVRSSLTGHVVTVLWPAVLAARGGAPNSSDPIAMVLGSRGTTALAASPTQLPFAAGGETALDHQGEVDFLAMGNLARSQAGAPALVADPQLAEVARQHSLDMMSEAYFAHDTPSGATPADRLRAAGVPFHRVGENIVFAPTLAVAFQSILGSPDHRENQLSTEYSRVGIGIIQSANGLMVTEDFAD